MLGCAQRCLNVVQCGQSLLIAPCMLELLHLSREWLQFCPLHPRLSDWLRGFLSLDDLLSDSVANADSLYSVVAFCIMWVRMDTESAKEFADSLVGLGASFRERTASAAASSRIMNATNVAS